MGSVRCDLGSLTQLLGGRAEGTSEEWCGMWETARWPLRVWFPLIKPTLFLFMHVQHPDSGSQSSRWRVRIWSR